MYAKDDINIYTKQYQELIKASYNFIDESAIITLFETQYTLASVSIYQIYQNL